MSDIPALPDNVSPDGREIWDWAEKLGRHTALLQKRRDLLGQISGVANRCGSCVHWMKRECPRETHSNTTGRSRGPSMKEFACQQFVMERLSAKLLEGWRTELADVRRKLEEPTR